MWTEFIKAVLITVLCVFWGVGFVCALFNLMSAEHPRPKNPGTDPTPKTMPPTKPVEQKPTEVHPWVPTDTGFPMSAPPGLQ